MISDTSNAAVVPPDANPPDDDGDALIARDGDGHGYEVTEPLRPELEPGTSITYKPDRWCAKCQQARASKRCVMCRSVTVPNTVNAGEPQVLDPAELARRDLAQLELERGYAAAPDVGQGDELEPPAAPPQRRPYVRDVSAPRSRNDSRNPPRVREEKRVMANPQRRHQRDYDDEGRSYGGSRGRVRTPAEELDSLWASAKVDEPKWVEFAAGFAAGGASPQEAANMADDLYAELIARQAFAVQGINRR